MPVPAGSQREAEPARRDHEDPDERDDATGARDREQHLLGEREVEGRDPARRARGTRAKHAIITTLLPIGAAAVIANRRFAYSSAGRDRAERVEHHLRA